MRVPINSKNPGINPINAFMAISAVSGWSNIIAPPASGTRNPDTSSNSGPIISDKDCAGLVINAFMPKNAASRRTPDLSSSSSVTWQNSTLVKTSGPDNPNPAKNSTINIIKPSRKIIRISGIAAITRSSC